VLFKFHLMCTDFRGRALAIVPNKARCELIFFEGLPNTSPEYFKPVLLVGSDERQLRALRLFVDASCMPPSEQPVEVLIVS
jgi:hypothetical protein